MRLSAKALAITAALIWGGCLLLVGLINLAAPSYGVDFLRGIGSIYPGFYHSRNFGDVLLGTVYALVDGAIAGWLIGWLYNRFVGPTQQSGSTRLDRAA
jgi:hypothetical protein